MKRWLQDRLGRSDDLPSHALDGAVIGDLEGPTAVIDDHGRIGAVDGSWWLEWGVTAEDRWRVSHDEVAVRQARIDDAPVYETWLRVPGGDVIQRVASANDGLGRVLVIEFENASGSAVGVAVAGRVAGAAALTADVDAVTLDEVEWLRAERPAGGVAAVVGDPWPAVLAGPDGARKLVQGDEASAALIVPLPHRQKVQFVALLDGAFPTRETTPEDIAGGWRTVTGDAASIDVPDTDVGEAWRRIVPDLVVQAGSWMPGEAADAAEVLDIAGLHDEADRARATVVDAASSGRIVGRDAVAALRSLASRELLAGEASGLGDLAGDLAATAGDALDAATLRLVARALDADSPQAAADARRAAETATGSHLPGSPAAAAAHRVLAQVIDTSATDRIDLLPDVPEAWLGQSVDVRSCGTANGRVSFSVRWHGDRPALLWERQGGSDAIELRCPGLDPSWSTLERQGEALLAAPGAD